MAPASSADQSPVFYLCGDTARNPTRSGIQTVVRSLAAAFGELRAPVRLAIWHGGSRGPALRPFPAVWSLGLGAESLREPPVNLADFLQHPAAWPSLLAAGGVPARVSLDRYPRSQAAPLGTWVLLPELIYLPHRTSHLVELVHRLGWRLAAIVHDAIPVQHPEFVPADLPAAHAEYLRGLSRADLILPNSEATAEGWREFIAREQLPSPRVEVCPLACDLPGTPRVRVPLPSTAGAGSTVRMLCVSTLEPRKNHRALFTAYERAAARRPGLRLELDLVGASYVGAGDLGDAARALVSRHPGRVRWHERVEHPLLQRLYAECDFTVYPSVLEGFGLPVIESLWFARPCLCADFGVMAENARGGGCLTADVRDPEALAAAILRLADSSELRQRLSAVATTRHLKTWREYAGELLAAMRQ